MPGGKFFCYNSKTCFTKLSPLFPAPFFTSSCPLAIGVFFVVDYFAPNVVPWLKERKHSAVAKFEQEKTGGS